MFDAQHLPGNFSNARTWVFIGDGQTVAATSSWKTWVKPAGVSWIYIALAGKGGNGGSGAIGANSAAAGGGGGGSGGLTIALLPAWSVPDTLGILVPGSGNFSNASYVTLEQYGQTISVNTSAILLIATQGVQGGNASGATAGVAGTAATAGSFASSPLASCGFVTFMAGQAGIVGGVAVSGGALTIPTTGTRLCGGTGGGGLPAAGATGTQGGAVTSALGFSAVAAAAAQATATSPPNTPDNGIIFQPNKQGVLGLMNYGGMGSGSTHGTATGGGLVQVKGGDGAPGCGGGGSGGALTGSTAAAGGLGGPGFCIITCW